MIRVMIVATHQEVREGLYAALELAGSLEVSLFPAGNRLTGASERTSECHGSASRGCLDVALINPALADMVLVDVVLVDVVLVDLEMPDGAGYQAIRLLKRRCPTIKAIALTAHDYPEARQKAIQAGADRFMLKGLDLTEMVNVIQAAAGEREDR